jgi:hypothetical protein
MPTELFRKKTVILSLYFIKITIVLIVNITLSINIIIGGSSAVNYVVDAIVTSATANI